MPISWLAILKNVPWSDVISNAPKVAESAKKLWNTVSKKPVPAELTTAGASQSGSAEPNAIAALQAQTGALETAVADLHGQMLASSELIKALADQNTQLVARIEANRRRTFWLTVAVGVFAVIATGAVVLLATQHGS